jgi:galactokinase/mevalonate kinase-like predicted kinase
MYGGSVISCTTRERAVCRLDTSADILTISNAGVTARLESRDDLALCGDVLDVARASLTFFDVDPETSRFQLDLRTDIPMRAGLAGSTALIAAIVGALDAYCDTKLNPYALAETTRKVEARVMKIVCGLQDQHMAIFGGLNFMDFCGKEMLEQHDDEPLGTVEPLASIIPHPPILLAHTGVQHHSGTVHRSPRERWLAGETLVRDTYVHLARLGRRGKRALVEQNWPLLGTLMNENHEYVSALGGSGPDNDRLIEAARRAGAWGAKLAGAGGGGTIIALTDAPDHVAQALMGAGADSIYHPTPSPGLTRTHG